MNGSNTRAALCAPIVSNDVIKSAVDASGVRSEEDVVREERESHAHEKTPQRLCDRPSNLDWGRYIYDSRYSAMSGAESTENSQ